MEQNHQTIFPITEIDKIIFGLLDELKDYPNLSLVNHYYHDSCNGFLSDFKKFLFETYRDFHDACIRNHLEVAKYLYKNKILVYAHHKEIQKEPYVEWLFQISASYKWLSTYMIKIPDMKDITQTIYYDINIHSNDESIFRHACRNGHFDVVKWLYGLDSITKINISKCDYDVFVEACRRDHLQIVKYLLEVEKVNIEPRIGYLLGKHHHIPSSDFPLITSICCHKNSDMLKFFLTEYNNINIHVDDEHAFRTSCKNGYLEIAKLLYQYGLDTGNPINIRVLNDDAFKQSCKKGHLGTAKWLETLCNEYFVVIGFSGIYANLKCSNFVLKKL